MPGPAASVFTEGGTQGTASAGTGRPLTERAQRGGRRTSLGASPAVGWPPSCPWLPSFAGREEGAGREGGGAVPAVAVEGSAADSPSCLSKAPAPEDTRSAQPSGPHSRPPDRLCTPFPPWVTDRDISGAPVLASSVRAARHNTESAVYLQSASCPLFKFQKKRNPKHSCVGPAILREGERPRRRLASARRRETQ